MALTIRTKDADRDTRKLTQVKAIVVVQSEDPKELDSQEAMALAIDAGTRLGLMHPGFDKFGNREVYRKDADEPINERELYAGVPAGCTFTLEYILGGRP